MFDYEAWNHKKLARCSVSLKVSPIEIGGKTPVDCSRAKISFKVLVEKFVNLGSFTASSWNYINVFKINEFSILNWVVITLCTYSKIKGVWVMPIEAKEIFSHTTCESKLTTVLHTFLL